MRQPGKEVKAYASLYTCTATWYLLHSVKVTQKVLDEDPTQNFEWIYLKTIGAHCIACTYIQWLLRAISSHIYFLKCYVVIHVWVIVCMYSDWLMTFEI